jgi:carboxymethylenebutenolidase
MNEIQRYLAEEIALDCNAGHITRPEALRRLRFMGLNAAMAMGLLAACGGSSGDDANDDTDPQGSAMPGATTQDGTMASNGGNTTASPGTSPENPPNPETNVVPLMPPSMMPAGMQPAGMSAGEPPSMMPAMNPDDAAPPADQGTPGASVDSALPTEAITFDGPNGELQGALAVPAGAPRGAVLVIHENRGLNDHTRTVAGRLATAGYVAIALDLLSEEGGTASFADAAAATGALGDASMADPTRFLEDMQAALDELERRAPGAKLGAIGFCFGGGQMWQLLAADARLAAVAPFYGQLPTGANFDASSAAVLAFYGELDARINATRDAADTALTAAGLTHEIVTEPGANHAFFNDTGGNFNAAAAADAWTRLIAFFRENLG